MSKNDRIGISRSLEKDKDILQQPVPIYIGCMDKKYRMGATLTATSLLGPAARARDIYLREDANTTRYFCLTKCFKEDLCKQVYFYFINASLM